MAFIDWRVDLETGVGVFDEQHKRLVGLINDLHDAMRSGQGRSVIGSVLQELVRYTDYHFSDEERAFDNYNYPEAESHKRAHSAFIKRMGELTAEYQKGDLTVTADTLKTLVDWLKDHIMGVDKAYAPYLAGKDL